MVERFRADRDQEYREFGVQCREFLAEIAKETTADNLTFAALEENEHDLQKLHTWLTKISARDFFSAPRLLLLLKRWRRASVPYMILRRLFTRGKAYRGRQRTSVGTSSAVTINYGYRYLGEGRTCLYLVLFMVQFGVKCWEVSLETALEHFNYTFPACCYISLSSGRALTFSFQCFE